MQSPFDTPLSGFRSPFGYGRRLGTAFNALMLFQNGEQGVAFEPDPNTCFTDTAGTTPAGVGDAVALMLDKSQGATYRNGVFGGLGPELVTNGGFDTDTVWGKDQGWTISGGTAQFVTTTNGNRNIFSGFSGVVGGFYLVEFDIVSITEGAFQAFVGGVFSPKYSTVGRHKTVLGPVTNNSMLIKADLGTTGSVDNFSIRELPGNHATQDTAAARPILARVPEGGRRNLLTRTEEFENSFWARAASTITADAATTPDGLATADKLVEDSGSVISPRVFIDPGVTDGNIYSYSIYIKDAGDSRGVRLGLGGAGFTTTFIYLNPETGTIHQGPGAVTDEGDGWYRASFSLEANNTEKAAVSVTLTDAPNSTTTSYTGDGTSGVYLWGAQFELGSTATPYQRVGSTYDVTEAGKADKWHLVDDQVDDVLNATLPDLGTDATVAYASDLGVTILTGQTIGAGDFDVLRDEQLFGMVIVDRALTVAETTSVTTYLEGKSP